MKVKELIEALKTVDPDLPVVTYANGHSYHSEYDKSSNGPLVVGIYHRGYDHEKDIPEGVIIGNVRRDRFNYPNDWMGKVIIKDGAKVEGEPG